MVELRLADEKRIIGHRGEDSGTAVNVLNDEGRCRHDSEGTCRLSKREIQGFLVVSAEVALATELSGIFVILN